MVFVDVPANNAPNGNWLTILYDYSYFEMHLYDISIQSIVIKMVSLSLTFLISFLFQYGIMYNALSDMIVKGFGEDKWKQVMWVLPKWLLSSDFQEWNVSLLKDSRKKAWQTDSR